MSTIVIKYDGTDITNSVIFSTASFESQLGAYPGSFEFTVRDSDQSLFFDTGKEVTLDIDGVRRYGGYCLQVSRQLAFPVDITVDGADLVKTREWVLRGSDYNILFDKRVLWNSDDPARSIPLFSGTTTDKAVIQFALNNYFSLDDDGIDIDTFVEVVGDPTPDNTDGDYGNPGTSWRKFMDTIAQFTGAIYYIDGEKKLHYQNIETASVDWGFSDTPDHVTTYGFRELEYIDDATNVVNDALVWGGSPFGSTGVTARTVFAEVLNDVSAAAVGRWQRAEPHFQEIGYFTASGCLIRGKVIVYGDPGAATPGLGDQERGLQNPQKNIRMTWFDHTVPTPLVAGTVVTTTLNVWDNIVVTLPVRSIRISFPVNYEAMYEGFFGIQTSDPWSLWKYLKKVITAPPPPYTPPPPSDGTDPEIPPNTPVGTSNLTPAADGVTTEFHLPYGYVANSTTVYVNGLLTTAYTETNPEEGIITFDVAPLSTDTIFVSYTGMPTQTGGGSTDGTVVSATAGALRAAIEAASPGDTLRLRGGDHIVGDGPIYIDKELTITNYGTEVPNITHPTARPEFLWFSDGPVLLDGLKFTGAGGYGDVGGSALVSMQDGSHDVTIQNCEFHGVASMGATQQLIYHHNTSGSNAAVLNCLVDGHGSGGFGVHLYPGPGPNNVLVQGNTIRNFPVKSGVLCWTDSSGIQILNNTFSHCGSAVRHHNSLGTFVDGNSGTDVGPGLEIDDATNLTVGSNDW